MAIPMSAQQIAEQRAKKRTNAPAAMPSVPAHINQMPMAASPKPVPRVATGPATANKIIPTATPQAAQTKVPGAIPGMVNQATKRPVATPMSAAQATAKPKTVNAPLNSNITSVRTGDELNQLASDQLAMQRSGLKNAADTQIASLQNSAKYANQLIQDNRVLENGNFERTNAPAAWDGSVGYRGAQLDRGRQIDDTMRAADLSNAMNSVNQDLYNFDSNAAATERGIANELLQNERGYGLDVGNQAISKGQLTGEYFDPQAQSIANQIVGLKQQAEAKGITAEQRAGLSAQATGLRSQLSNMGFDANQFGANVNSSAAQGNMSGLSQKTLAQQSQDFSERADIRNYKRGVLESDRNFEIDKDNATIQQRGADLSNQLASLQLENYPEEQRLRIEQMRKEMDQIGKDPYQSAADQRMDELKIEMSELELEKMREVTTDTPTAEDMRTYFDSMVQRDPYDNSITNATAVENAIVNSELSDYDSYQLYLRYGLPWGGPIPTKPGK